MDPACLSKGGKLASGIRFVQKAPYNGTSPRGVPQAAQNAEDEDENAESAEETEYTVRGVACTWEPFGDAAVCFVGARDVTVPPPPLDTH